MHQGDSESFNKNWQEREEAFFTHWTKDKPQNQIQLAFRNHWTLFNELMKSTNFNGGKRCLEIGCGRGSLSCYFSDAGYNCTLADLSAEAIQIAQKMFEINDLKGKFCVEDTNKLSFPDNSFDIVVSIGLLEHFDDVAAPIREQIRVLDKGGLFLGYVVPKYTDNIQKDFNWINEILKGYEDTNAEPKEQVFRSDAGSSRYIEVLKELQINDINVSGVYPLPMISHSIEFPFTLMPEYSEKVLVDHFERILKDRKLKTGKHPWLCEEGYGQAFLVWGYKA